MLMRDLVGSYLVYCEKVRRMSGATLSMKRDVLERFMRVVGVEKMEELTNEGFGKWIDEVGNSGVRASSLNMYISVVRTFVKYCRDAGMVVPVNLALVVKLKEEKSRRRFYTAEEVMAVVTMADEQTGLMIRIMFETGMRIAELVKLKVSNFDGRCVRFVGKGKRVREAYVRSETYELIASYIERYGVQGYLWSIVDGYQTLNGEPPTVNTVRVRLRRAFEAAGFSGFYPHALRHSFATDLQMRGASVEEIKEMIGHSSVATTERYLHGFEGRMRELFDKYR